MRGAPEPPQSLSLAQFGLGRVSGEQTPWLQYLPEPHSLSMLHWALQWPPAQTGAAAVHCASLLHDAPTSGIQTPDLQLNPLSQLPFVHDATHWPSAQSRPSPHSLADVQLFWTAVHVPSTQASVLLQSAFVEQVEGRAAGLQLPPTQSFPGVQSALDVQVPPSAPPSTVGFAG